MDAAWKAWPAGSYYYDVTIPKQGKMKNAASHMGAQDAKESWKPTTPPPSKKLTNMAGETVAAPNDQIMSGSPYTAHITAQSNASEHFWLYDTIDVTSQKVLIGGADKDDFSKITVTDQNGNTVKADITVDDRQTGKRIVKAHVLNPASGQYTLNVPQSATPTGSDYVIPDDSQACWTGDEYGNTDASHCQTGNSEQVGKITPKPDKVWVLDSNGALKADDPQWTNDKGADNRTFVTGDPIGAVVNGRIPAHLLNPFTSYSITDDWTASAQYI
ncbi:MAG: cell wall anchor protein, partial [Bifidobacterium sp.]|nr:cell wall anchor protein [Bifidobacterium sp.]